jgi:ABC-type transport system involved in multi-copper enzyme maturation permease subunit
MTGEAATLRPIETTHPLRGLGGMLSAELRAWFPWRVLFLTIAGFGVFAMIYAPWRASGVNPLGALLYPFLGFWIALLLLSAVSLTEGSVLGEIERGTASWLVGMPIGRPAVVVAKFLAAAAGITVTVFATGIPLYPIIADASRRGITEFSVNELTEVVQSPIGMWGRFTTLPDWGTYLAMLAALAALLVFVIAVMILLGTTLRSRTAVFALGLGVLGVFGAAALAGNLAEASPAGLIAAIGNVAQGNEASFAVPLLATLAWTGAVLLLAVWRFSRTELT